MRSGFAAGDGDFLDTLAEIRNLTAPQMPGPIQHASTAVWSEEQHVSVIRQAYRAKFNVVRRAARRAASAIAGRPAASSCGST